MVKCRNKFTFLSIHNCSCLSAESSGIFCRICHEGDGKEELISPCKCAGTMGLIHVSCIEKWLSQAGTSKCEICGFEYITEKTPRSLYEVWGFLIFISRMKYTVNQRKLVSAYTRLHVCDAIFVTSFS